MATPNQQPPSPPSGGPWTAPNGIKAQYDLHCHCGAVRYTMALSPPLYVEEAQGKERCTAIECACSFCERNGYIAAHPLASDVQFSQGREHRVNYYSGSRRNPHWFCGKCGSVLGTDLTWLMQNVLHAETRYTINLRMLKGFDPKRLQIRQDSFMKNAGSKYEV